MNIDYPAVVMLGANVIIMLIVIAWLIKEWRNG